MLWDIEVEIVLVIPNQEKEQMEDDKERAGSSHEECAPRTTHGHVSKEGQSSEGYKAMRPGKTYSTYIAAGYK